jgi:hypothetical protein
VWQFCRVLEDWSAPNSPCRRFLARRAVALNFGGARDRVVRTRFELRELAWGRGPTLAALAAAHAASGAWPELILGSDLMYDSARLYGGGGVVKPHFILVCMENQNRGTKCHRKMTPPPSSQARLPELAETLARLAMGRSVIITPSCAICIGNH